MATAVAGSIATIINDGVMTPSDVVKQRLQVANSPYRGMVDCILRVSREEGTAAFFKSYRTTVRACSCLLPMPDILCFHLSASAESYRARLANDMPVKGCTEVVCCSPLANNGC